MDGSWRNAALRDIYLRAWPELAKQLGRDSTLSSPYLAWVHPDYDVAEIRLVVVGKETNGWGETPDIASREPADAVTCLMRDYRDFRLGSEYPGKASYWTPVHELYRALNPSGPPLGFVALNTSKMDAASAMPGEAIRDAIVSTNLLPDEIRVLEPHVVVFHSGPDYDPWIRLWFPDVSFEGDEWLVRLQSAALPPASFRTYHPRYLNYQSKRAEIYNRIREACMAV
jgi:hypothetical protein